MKRVICLLLALLLLTPAVFANGEATFYMEDVTANVGDTFTLVGAVKDAPVCASFRIIMTYDDTVLEVVKGKKLDADGLFIINTKATHKVGDAEKKAVVALSADATKVLEGDMDLFSVTFKVIAETAGDHGTPVDVVYEEFFDEDLNRVHPAIESATVYVGSDTPAPEDTTPDDGATTPDDGATTPDDGATTPDDGATTPDDGATAPDAGTEPDVEATPDEKEDFPVDAPVEPEKKPADKTPTGSWELDEKNNEFLHLEENGTGTIYTPEFVETPEVGKVTDVILKDETGKEVGSIKVEKQEDGSIDVIEQDLTPPSAKKPGSLPVWVWPLVGFGVVAVAAIIFVLIFAKKKKEEETTGEENEE